MSNDNEDPRKPDKKKSKSRASKKSSAETVNDAVADAPQELTEQAVIDLAGLTPLEYAKKINATAKTYRVQVRHLEKLVETAKVEQAAENLLHPYWGVEPAANEVSAIRLLSDIVARIKRHVVVPDEAALVVALWVMLTWVHDKITFSPILLVTSPEPNSGKTTLLDLIKFMVRRGFGAVGATGPVLYRSIEKWGPTFVIDEADDAFVDNPDLRQVVNSGWTPGTGVPRCDPDTHEPMMFPTFCPKALGMKGKKLPDTTMGRTIVIEMRRKLASEEVAEFRHIDDEVSAEVRTRLARWGQDNAEAIGKARPARPAGFINRLGANWEAIFAIADSVSKETGEKAREAATLLALGGGVATSTRLELLADIREIFDREGKDQLSSLVLCAKLAADEEKPWREWGPKFQPITQRALADLLAGFRAGEGVKKIEPDKLYFEGVRARGYRRADFEDAWRRYLDPANGDEAPSTPSQSVPPVPLQQNQWVSPENEVSHVDGTGHFEKAPKSLKTKAWDGRDTLKGENGASAADSAPTNDDGERVCRRCGCAGGAVHGQLIRAGQDGNAGHYHPRCWTEERTKGPRRVPADRRPALGPEGDSLDDFK
jgi:putative DNA primase/helicase